MNFRKATDALLGAVTLADLAKEMGVSVQALRQARAAEGSSANRAPPGGWESAIAGIARHQERRYRRLADALSPTKPVAEQQHRKAQKSP